MKAGTFLVGAIAGAAAAVALSKKFMGGKCACSEAAGADENPAVKEAAQAVDTLRGSADGLRKEPPNRTESEQTYAAKCEELKDQVAKQGVEIENLKNICEKQDGQNKKLEEELAQAKAGK